MLIIYKIYRNDRFILELSYSCLHLLRLIKKNNYKCNTLSAIIIIPELNLPVFFPAAVADLGISLRSLIYRGAFV